MMKKLRSIYQKPIGKWSSLKKNIFYYASQLNSTLPRNIILLYPFASPFVFCLKIVQVEALIIYKIYSHFHMFRCLFPFLIRMNNMNWHINGIFGEQGDYLNISFVLNQNSKENVHFNQIINNIYSNLFLCICFNVRVFSTIHITKKKKNSIEYQLF